MPISSGATGRVDVGVDASIIWTPDGLKRETKPVSRNCDSYLKRYLETTQRRKLKSEPMEDDNLPHESQETDGAKDKNVQKNGGSGHDTSDQPSGEDRPKKSRLCALL